MVPMFSSTRTRVLARTKKRASSKRCRKNLLETSAYDAATVRAITSGANAMGIPLSTKCVALYTNLDLVADPPRTLEAIEHEKLDKNVFPLAYEADTAYYHAALLSAFGGTLLREDGTYGFDSEAGARSLELLHRLSTAHVIPEEPNGPLVTHLFVSGKAASVIGGPWLRADLGERSRYRVTKLPTVDVGGTPSPMRPLLTVEAAMLTPRGKIARARARFFALHRVARRGHHARDRRTSNRRAQRCVERCARGEGRCARRISRSRERRDRRADDEQDAVGVGSVGRSDSRGLARW